MTNALPSSSLSPSTSATAPPDLLSLEFDNKRAKIDYFSKDCTAITDYLFVGGKKVASSEEKLREKGITHVISQSTRREEEDARA